MELTVEKEKVLLQEFFDESRFALRHFLEERGNYFSNAQLFAFILVSPISIAIASDGTLDLAEISMLIDVAAYFEKDVLPEALNQLRQPAKVMSNQDFRKIVYSELKYLCLHMQCLEKPLITCLHNFIQLDEHLSRQNSPQFSIKQKIKEMMHGVIYNNLGKDTIEEVKIKKVLQTLKLT